MRACGLIFMNDSTPSNKSFDKFTISKLFTPIANLWERENIQVYSSQKKGGLKEKIQVIKRRDESLLMFASYFCCS